MGIFKMVQSGLISVTVIALSNLATVTLGQLDHFLPPPPARINRRRPLQQQRIAAQTPVTSGNPYLSRAYGGTWFRSNFQDLFSYRGAQKLEWFEILDGLQGISVMRPLWMRDVVFVLIQVEVGVQILAMKKFVEIVGIPVSLNSPPIKCQDIFRD